MWAWKPDARLGVLEICSAQKGDARRCGFVDIAGLVRGASRGEDWEISSVAYPGSRRRRRWFAASRTPISIRGRRGRPLRDMETIALELLFADIDTAARWTERKAAKSGDKNTARGGGASAGKRSGRHAARTIAGVRTELCAEGLLTAKPALRAQCGRVQLGRDPAAMPDLVPVVERAAAEGAEVVVVSAAIEEQIASMDESEAREYLEMLGAAESGLDRLIRKSYALLGLISFLTAGEKEVRAWTIERGTKAPQAAGKIHSDFERGFIRAEVIPYDRLAACGSMAAARERGLIRSEGKQYVIQDGMSCCSALASDSVMAARSGSARPRTASPRRSRSYRSAEAAQSGQRLIFHRKRTANGAIRRGES